jgi:dTMP kinase
MSGRQGLFITVEGGEGVGKSTNISVLRDWLQRHEVPFVETREPGGTPLAEDLRSILLATDREPLAVSSELLLVFAARAQHLQQVIEPALREGSWVLCDRFTDATYAYQGGGRGFPTERIAMLEQWVQGVRRPDCTLLIDTPVEVGLRRAGERGELDRFEREESAFFERVRACYLARAAAEPQRFRILDGTRSLQTLAGELEALLEALYTGWEAQA